MRHASLSQLRRYNIQTTGSPWKPRPNLAHLGSAVVVRCHRVPGSFAMDDSEQGELVRQLEERLLQPEVRRSPQDVAELLADEFIEFGSSGRVFNKHSVLECLQHEEPAQRSIEDFQAIPLAPGVMLTTYRGIQLAVAGAEPT